MIGKYFEDLWNASAAHRLNVPTIIVESALVILVYVLFYLTQRKALRRCSVPNRTMSPGLVWLQWIPFFNLAWQFFVVKAVSQSLENEFRSPWHLHNPSTRPVAWRGKIRFAGLWLLMSLLLDAASLS